LAYARYDAPAVATWGAALPSVPDNGHDPRDEAAERHKTRVNIIAAVGLGLLLLLAFGTLKLFVDHENLQKCVDSGRKDCVDLGAEPRGGVRVITR